VVTSGIANLTDQNNQDYSTLTDERDQVTLPGLDGSGRLQGTYATTAPSTKITRAYNASNQFLFTRSQSGFDETMCYYHVDHDERYIQSLGFNNINNRQVGIDVNGITDDNSFYSPSTKRVTFGTGGVNDAQDSDVIWHEMGHAIQDNQVPGWGSSHEGGSMGEGFGDYWAGSESAGVGPMAPGWDVYVAEWDAVSYNPGNPAYLRVLNSTKHYPEDMEYQVHADGEIWSAVIWQVRGLVGRARGDTLVLESHFSVPTTGTFEDGANAIIQANRDLYGGADEAAIRTLFVQRGILESIAAPTNLTANLEGSNAIRLDWQDNSAEETGFRVERKVNAGSWQTAGSVGPNVETYLDANLDPWTRYTYRVVATSTMGDSKASNEAGLRTPPASYTISGQTRTQLGAAIPGVIIDGSGFQSVTNQQTVNANLNIPDNNTSGVTSNLAWSLAGTVMDIQVYVNITHTWIGDLEVSVIGPTGTTVMLHNRTGGSADNLVTSYPDQTQPAQSLDAFIGKLAQGTWKLKVRDLASQDTGKLNSWRLTLMTNSGVTFTATTGGDGTFSIGNLLNGATEIHLRNPKGKWTPRSYNLNLTGDVGGLDFTRRDPIIRP
jgi:subtilisin-like proprotein convertase family protein